MIERCIFVLCLDERMDYPPPEVGKPIDSDDEPLGLHMLHGGGVENNTGNRWFDKTMQVSVELGSSIHHVLHKVEGTVIRKVEGTHYYTPTPQVLLINHEMPLTSQSRTC